MKSVLLIPLKLSATPHSDRASLNFYRVSKAVNYSPVWSAQANTCLQTPSTLSPNGVFPKKVPVKKKFKNRSAWNKSLYLPSV